MHRHERNRHPSCRMPWLSGRAGIHSLRPRPLRLQAAALRLVRPPVRAAASRAAVAHRGTAAAAVQAVHGAAAGGGADGRGCGGAAGRWCPGWRSWRCLSSPQAPSSPAALSSCTTAGTHPAPPCRRARQGGRKPGATIPAPSGSAAGARSAAGAQVQAQLGEVAVRRPQHRAGRLLAPLPLTAQQRVGFGQVQAPPATRGTRTAGRARSGAGGAALLLQHSATWVGWGAGHGRLTEHCIQRGRAAAAALLNGGPGRHAVQLGSEAWMLLLQVHACRWKWRGWQLARRFGPLRK